MNFACQEVMGFALAKKAVLFLSVLAAFAFALGVRAVRAEAPQFEKSISRSLVVWEQPIQYQFIIKNNPRLPFDGEASRKQVSGKEIHFIVLNKAFFHREAKDLFARFEKNYISMGQDLLSKEDLRQIETFLMTLKISPEGSPSLDQKTILLLKHLKENLEYLAWSPLYRISLQENRSQKEAERRFKKEFIQTRLETIEWHEVAHLSDIKGTSDTKGEAFGRFTELNAFYAELAYGTNPHDVMAQALAGLIDELNQGKNVDFSLEKVATVLKFLKECPRFAKHYSPGQFNEGGPLPRSCLEILARLKTSDFIMVARELRQQNLQALGQNLASLR